MFNLSCSHVIINFMRQYGTVNIQYCSNRKYKNTLVAGLKHRAHLQLQDCFLLLFNLLLQDSQALHRHQLHFLVKSSSQIFRYKSLLLLLLLLELMLLPLLLLVVVLLLLVVLLINRVNRRRRRRRIEKVRPNGNGWGFCSLRRWRTMRQWSNFCRGREVRFNKKLIQQRDEMG